MLLPIGNFSGCFHGGPAMEDHGLGTNTPHLHLPLYFPFNLHHFYFIFCRLKEAFFWQLHVGLIKHCSLPFDKVDGSVASDLPKAPSTFAPGIEALVGPSTTG